MSNIKAVILDIDQTLTVDQGSWLQFTDLLGADSQAHTDIFVKFKKGELTYEVAKKQLIDLWRSVSRLTKDDIQQIFSKIALREGALEAVTYLKSKYKLCLISGAIDVFVDVIAEKLQISDRYASTKFIFGEDDILSDFEYKLNRGEDKVGFLQDFCSKNNLDPSECSAIGDGESDMPIFAEVKLPILFIAAETTSEQKEAIDTHLTSWLEISKFL